MKERWTEDRALAWQQTHAWPLGVNYVTSDAVNSVEMWMNDTFHPQLIEKELRLAASLGYNSVRVFLPFTVWEKEKQTFEANFDGFLEISARCALTVMPILFDDCAFDFGSEPVYGRQAAPVPGVHNSRWVPSPGFRVQDDPSAQPLLKEYLETLIGAHRDDARILVWDLYNEPGNTARFEKCLPLLQDAFAWARALDPVQPLTSPIFLFDGNESVNRFLLENSDVISLHAYTPLKTTQQLVERYRQGNRPMLITEWLHRPAGNTIREHLPYFCEQKIGVWQWGMLVGRTQTNLSWDTMNGGVPEPDPAVWQHDILYPDGAPYDPEELALIARFGEMAKKKN